MNLMEDVCIHPHRYIDIENTVRDDQQPSVPEVSPEGIRRFETFPGEDMT